MKLVQVLLVRDDAEMVDAQIAYHLNAGVDFMVATDLGSTDGTTEILEPYVQEGYLRLIREPGELREGEGEWRTRLARLAATELGADWIISTDAREFWWPRGESLKDVLAAIPERYTIVQALVREFVARPVDGELFAERMTVRRRAVPRGRGHSPEALEGVLRPIFRADPELRIGAAGAAESAGSVPLRAWYPIEVFRFPSVGEVPSEEEVARGLADGSLVEDTRLRDALRALETVAAASSRRFALPDDGASRLALEAPNIVDEAAYAVECAEVGEVDVTLLEKHIDELEQRIAWLEARFWPRVMRGLLRLVRR